MKIRFIIIICVFFVLSSCKQDPLIIEPFKEADRDEILQGNHYYVTQNYLVKNYNKSEKIEKLIQDHICANLRKDYKSIDSYFILVYKYSDKVNQYEHIHNKKFCELEMIDAVVFAFEFRKGHLLKTKYKNGKEIEPLLEFNCK